MTYAAPMGASSRARSRLPIGLRGLARATLCAVCVAAPVLGGLQTAPAAAGATDSASARAYVQADLALVLAAKAHLRAGEAAPLKVLAQVRRECPGAAAGSPQDPESTQMSNEVIGAMVLSAYQLDVPAIERFIARTSRLAWGDARLRRAVRAYAAHLRVLVRLSAPRLCADVRAWVAGGYTALPESTVRFDRQFMPAWVAVGMLPGGLRAHLSPSDTVAFARAQAIEVQITDAEARAVESWGKIMNELGLEP
jgi:hypothetical protein